MSQSTLIILLYNLYMSQNIYIFLLYNLYMSQSTLIKIFQSTFKINIKCHG